MKLSLPHKAQTAPEIFVPRFGVDEEHLQYVETAVEWGGGGAVSQQGHLVKKLENSHQRNKTQSGISPSINTAGVARGNTH
jgi:hypothetical protein